MATERNGNGNGGPLFRILRGLHVGATITLALFIYQQWEIGRERDQLQREKLVVLYEQVRQMQASGLSALDAEQTAKITELEHRLELQRTDLVRLQDIVHSHIREDVRRR